jgi:hypothetical protein
MLSRPLRRRSWAHEYRHQGDVPSLFRMLARGWRPVLPGLRRPEKVDDGPSLEPERKIPTYWSPWLLIK